MEYDVQWISERYALPIYISENGQSCNDRVYLDGKVHDADRIDFLHRYLLCLCNAIAKGVKARGCFHGSWTDNSEWQSAVSAGFCE